MPKTVETYRTTKALRKPLARLPAGRAASEAAAERLGEEAAQAVRWGGA